MRAFPRLLLLGLAPLCAATDFDSVIRLMTAKCSGCHSSSSFTKAGIVVAGDPDASRLFQYVSSGKMPMGGPKLTEAEIAAIREWIVGGGNWGAGWEQKKKTTFWAFRPPVKTQPPAGEPNPIDSFLFSKLQSKGLQFNPPANHRDLIRRLHFTLTGLPPAPEDYARSYQETVDRLLASPEYGERWARHWLDVVRYGETDGGEHNFERFHAWRFRDYVIDALNRDIPYTQFIREQLTGDLLDPENPKMVAATGFLVAGPWDSVSAELNKDALMKKTARMDELDDMVTTTFHSFQALTVNCARCHDHKFDPIPTREYYQLTSVFGGVAFGTREVTTEAEKAAYEEKVKPLRAEMARVQKQIDQIELPVKTRLLRERYAALDHTRSAEKFRLPVTAFYNRNVFAPVRSTQFRLVITGHAGKIPKIDELRLLPAGGGLKNWAGTEVASVEKPVIVTLAALEKPVNVSEMVWSSDKVTGRNEGTIRVYTLQAFDGKGEWRAVASSLDHVSSNEIELPTVSDNELISDASRPLRGELAAIRARMDAIRPPAQVYAAKPHPIENAYLLERGSVAKPKDEVQPGALSALTHRASLFSDVSDRRMALADWITDEKNPLTARVVVNRVWYHHFGNGIVNTPSDFGLMGDRPSHQDLLDHLAVAFMENGWSLKWLHRQILASKAWQQSSAMNEKAFAVDADNRLVWRMTLKRMDAETLRDSILAVTGKLNHKRGGPGFLLQKKGTGGSYIYAALDNDGPDVWRRGIYRFVVRGGERIFMDSFDCPDPSVATPQRSSSNTPVQALTLFNNAFVLKQAGYFAERIRQEAGDDKAAQVQRAYMLLYGRDATESERQSASKFLAKYPLDAFARVLFNTNEFVYTP